MRKQNKKELQHQHSNISEATLNNYMFQAKMQLYHWYDTGLIDQSTVGSWKLPFQPPEVAQLAK